jgi:hypothetical protein
VAYLRGCLKVKAGGQHDISFIKLMTHHLSEDPAHGRR